MRFRFLADCYVGGHYFQAGNVAEMPASFIPPAACEPLDAEAAQAFFDAGPQITPLCRQQWSDRIITNYPTTYWRPTDAAKENWELTGLGRGLGVKRWTSDADKSAP
jgi:hypothetical protein